MSEMSPEVGTQDVIDILLKAAGGCAVINGEIATQLEVRGAVFDKMLWSAICLITEPHLIKQVHLEFLEAGADITMTCSYQATLPGFLSKGLSVEEGEKLLQKSVHLAVEARDQFWVNVQSIPNHSYNRALVAASIGSYGAYLADGSEYRGNYGPSVNLEKLKDFHRRRLQVLLEAQPDMLAFETIPNKLEAMACAELLEEENVQIASLISFSCVDGENMASGESFEECLAVLNESERVKVVGVNCTSPNFIESLITRFKKVTAKHIAVYPNSGEIWNAESKKWMASCNGDEKLVAFVHRWHELGASFIGGCCRTTPSDIRGISKALKERM